jgi:hypothetical protein
VLARVDRVRCTDPACPDLAEAGRAGKTFVTRHPDGRKGKPRELDGVLYRLPEVLAAIEAGRPVYLCEGEGDADAVAAAGECGTSAYGGAARKWHPGYTRRLMGARVVIVADNDPPGYRRAAAAAEALGSVPESVRIVRAAVDRPGADVSDHLTAGLPLSALAAVPAEALAPADGPAPDGPAPAAAAAAHDDDADDDAAGAVDAAALADAPAHRLPASSGAWAYATGDDGDGRARGVYRLNRYTGHWEWIEYLPYVFERVAHRDGTGRRARMSYRLGTRLDAPPDERTVAGHLAVKDGSWAEPLGVPLSADPKVMQAVASAIYREAERSAPLVEAAPRWTDNGDLDMPPVDVGPAGYGVTAGTEDHAREIWAGPEGMEPVLGRHPRAALAVGAGVSAIYVAALRRQSFIVNLAGRDRRGKTTAHLVTAAVYGDPELIVRPWDVSAIGLSQLAGEYGCLPPILDELGARRGPRGELQSIVFQLAQGAKRTRGGREGTSRLGAPWRGVVLSTGNMSLLAALTERGAIARVIEIPTPIIGTDDAVDDPDAAADAERLEALAAEAYGWPFAWIRAAGITPDRFGAVLAAAETDLEMPPGGTLRTLARHLAAAVAGAAVLDLALGTVTLRPAALAAAAALLAEMADRLAEMAAPPGARLADAVAHAVISRAEAFPALGDLRDPASGRRYRDGEGFTIPEPPDLGTDPAASAVARWAPPPGLAAGDVGVWCAALPKITTDAGLDDSVTALRELRDSARLITGGEKGGAQMRYRVRVAGQSVPAYVFRVGSADDDDARRDGGGPGGGQDDAPESSRARARTRPTPDLVGTVGTDQLANQLPAETTPQAVPTGVGTDQLGRHSTPESTPENRPPAETAPEGDAADSGPDAKPQVEAVPTAVPTSARPVPTDAAGRWPLGPILLADAGACYLADGSDLTAPATLADLADMAAALAIGGPRLHKAGHDYGPEVYLTPAASERYGIPAEPDPDDDTGHGLALADDHPAVMALRAAGWRLSALRVSSRVWRPGPERASVGVTLLGWAARTDPAGLGALLADNPSPASLAARLGRLAALTVPPTWTAGVTAETMMTALRPAERVRRDPATGDIHRTPVPGSLAGPVPPSIYDAPDSHPAARGRPPGQASRDEALDWTRPAAEWTDAERAAPWAVTVDTCAAFLAACSSLPLGLDAPREMTAAELADCNADPAAFLRRRAGAFVAEVTGLREALDPRLPCPLTETGQWPDGPLTLHAPALRYALEYPGVVVAVTAGAVHSEHGPYLDPWARRLTAAYLAMLAEAGITPDMDPAAFLAAYAGMPARHPDAYAVRRVVQALYKAGIGRLRHLDERARDRATWRPHMRAEVISRSRVDLHRKAVRVLALTGAAPLAWATDALTYAAPDPDALSVIPRTLDGGQVPGCLRIGPRPGWVKFSHAEPMAEALARAAEGDNPAIERVPDDDDADDDGGPGGGE